MHGFARSVMRKCPSRFASAKTIKKCLAGTQARTHARVRTSTCRKREDDDGPFFGWLAPSSNAPLRGRQQAPLPFTGCCSPAGPGWHEKRVHACHHHHQPAMEDEEEAMLPPQLRWRRRRSRILVFKDFPFFLFPTCAKLQLVHEVEEGLGESAWLFLAPAAAALCLDLEW